VALAADIRTKLRQEVAVDPVDDFRQASRMRFDLNLHYKIDALARTQEEKDRGTSGICLQKPPGKLEFTLNTQFLNISALKTNFDILFTGTKISANRVRWDATLPTGPVAVKTKVADATIKNLAGSFETVVSSIAPPLSDTSCSGEQQGLIAAFTTPDDSGQLSADADAGFTTATISVSRLQVVGNAGDPENFSVLIQQYPQSECVAAAVEGGSASFFALVNGVPPSAPVSYQWSIDGGAVPIGSTTSASFKAQMPSAPANVTVSVVVTVTFANSQTDLSASRAVPVITTDIAFSMERFCKLFMEARINQFVRPLHDPLRDLVTRPISLGQARDLQTFSQRLSRLSTALISRRSRTQARRKSEVSKRARTTRR
jgi:hypothetical protein